ncbi:MAG: PD40 domain-containing protein [Ignavibacteriaceae bacterium]|nr:PD40 domain-containing protein [Ignavibacteriaceae bacterium]
MKSRILFVFVFAFNLVLNSQTAENYLFEGEKRLTNLRMLTNSGENAEAYWSFDETKLIYQAKIGDMKCDQIFVMNADGSDKRMVSSGKGRTTCSYFLPGDSKIVYASTKAYMDECPPPPDFSRGYVWKLYDEFEIFIDDPEGGNPVQVTFNEAYDAEATVSPKGDKILFTSFRDGDPEIYVMDIDGSNQTRLTFEQGYDGGAFFSWDGELIVFRASRPKTKKELDDYNDLVVNKLVRPTTLEIYVMNADGSNIRQVTNFGKASFAPFFHPDNKRIIFSSNINSKDGRAFDLYMVDIDGSNLEQITFNKSFDGFPMFTSDGKRLVFASNRFGVKEGDTNIFVADWVEVE